MEEMGAILWLKTLKITIFHHLGDKFPLFNFFNLKVEQKVPENKLILL